MPGKLNNDNRGNYCVCCDLVRKIQKIYSRAYSHRLNKSPFSCPYCGEEITKLDF